MTKAKRIKYEARVSKPKLVIRKSSMTEDLYLQNDGRYGQYRTAKRFKDQESAIEFAEAIEIDDSYGIFSVSSPWTYTRRNG